MMNMEQFRGPVKIKDGLYMGDLIAAQDLEFLMTNKVTNIINCAGKQVKNLWESIGITYLTFPFQESDKEVLFDVEGRNMQRVTECVEQARSRGESCLIHSEKGQSRCSCIVTAYLMTYYSWSLYKCLEFLNSRRPDLEIRTSFFKQLNQLEQLNKQPLSKNWINPEDPNTYSASEEELVSKTYVNSLVCKVTNINQRQYTNISKKLLGMRNIPRSLSFNQQIQVFHLKPTFPSINPYNAKNKPKGSTIKQSCLKDTLSQTQSYTKTKQIPINTNPNNNNSTLKPKHGKTKSLHLQKGSQLNNSSTVKGHQVIQTNEANETLKNDQKINNIQGNIIHVTVNNFLQPNKDEKHEVLEAKQKEMRQSSDEVYESILQKYSNISNPKHQKSQSQSHQQIQQSLQNQQKQKQQMANQQQQINAPKKNLNKKYQPTPPRQYLNSGRSTNANPSYFNSIKQSTGLNAGHLLNKELNHPNHSGKTNKQDINIGNNSTCKVQPFKIGQKVNPREIPRERDLALTTSQTKTGRAGSVGKAVGQKVEKSKQIILDLKSNSKIMNNFYNNKYKKV